MYLKKIEMQGFKSFADKTEINFEDNITAVVGPNGSGKSNVSDAVRWVLGEQSAKSLRGGRMEDIIFSGTDKRRPLGFAEVSITFDNTSRMIPIDYSEVSVTRRIFRSGDSEFYINKNACRLKDIRELFMDTGIGRDGYSIIGQGRISEILSDRPEDRRAIFEEAAGIVKYKSKKEESEKKLEKTDENLIRINDLFHEVSNQFDTISKDAEKANEYLKLYEELKDLEINVYIRQIKQTKDSIDLLNKDIDGLNKSMNNINKTRKEKEDIFNELKEKSDKYDILIEEIRKDHMVILKEIDNKKNKIQMYSEKEMYQNRDMERLNKEIESLNKTIKDLEEENKQLEENKIELDKDSNYILKEFEQGNKELKIKNSTILKDEKALEQIKDNIIKLYNKSSDVRSQLNSIDSFNDNIKRRIDQLEKELDNIKSKEDKILKDKEESELLEKDEINRFDKLRNLRETLKDKEESISSKIQRNLDEARKIQMKLEGMSSSYNLYKNMEEGYEGYYRSVKNLLSSIDNNRLDDTGFIGVVADLIQVNKKYEKAIDITLGSSVQNIVTQTESDAKRMIDYLKKNNMGRVTFLPINSVKGSNLNIDIEGLKKDGVLGLANDLVKYDAEYELLFRQLLGRTIIVDNIDNGIKLARRFNHRYRIVTLDGDVLNPGGSLTGGSYRKNAISIISRKNKIDELEDDIEKNKSNLNSLEELHKDYKIEFEDNKKELEDIENKTKEYELQFLEIKNKKEAFNVEIARIEQDRDKNNKEISSLEFEIKDYHNKKEKYKEELKDIEAEIESMKKIVREKSEMIDFSKEEKDKLSSIVTDLKIKLNSRENDLNNIINNIKINKENIIRNKKSIEEKDIEINSIKQGLGLMDKDRLNIIDRIKEEEKKEKELENRLSKKIKDKEKIMNSFYEEQEDLRKLNEELSNEERKKNNKELELSKNKLELENKSEKLLEDYELEYESALEFKDKNMDIESVMPRVKELKKSIRKLGNINLSSLEDYQQIKERYEFLDEQQQDLVYSKENLENVIKDIESKMSDKFMESFHIINKNFEIVFKSLFNGGEANLKLTDEEDILESGVEINVQPPGKKLQNIRLLSGGEKSLTAVALLFAILEMKPSPFCILDEIDAALDDANIGRYTDYLKELNDTTQFILITHRKPAMEISNVLYGVTMGEEGVSKLYSMKMTDYIEDMDGEIE